jgi:hypothetical protein
MTSRQAPGKGDDESGQQYENKMFRLKVEAARAFDVLKGKMGPRAGPRLAAEAIDLLLQKYGEKPVGPLRPAASSGAGETKPALAQPEIPETTKARARAIARPRPPAKAR